MIPDLRGIDSHGKTLGKPMRMLHALRVQVRHYFIGVALLRLQLQPLLERPGCLPGMIDGVFEVLRQSGIYVVRDQLLVQIFEFGTDARKFLQ